MNEGDECEDTTCDGVYEWQRDEEHRQHLILTCSKCGETTGEMEPMY